MLTPPQRPRPRPNDRLPCGTWSARTNHLAHGQSCRRCGTDRPIPNHYPTKEVAHAT